MTRHARCSCGQLKLETAGEPVRVAICHCLACQLRTGSVLGVRARFARSDIRTEGRPVDGNADGARRLTNSLGDR